MISADPAGAEAAAGPGLSPDAVPGFFDPSGGAAKGAVTPLDPGVAALGGAWAARKRESGADLPSCFSGIGIGAVRSCDSSPPVRIVLDGVRGRDGSWASTGGGEASRFRSRADSSGLEDGSGDPTGAEGPCRRTHSPITRTAAAAAASPSR
ncbi:MAG TPA: hypothetical protein VKF61_11030 [Candidatus Polarisedimenticolia bacterium]|nr:hypothetical protein [Candidatus Polarisedimenticolia bacterium]